MTAADRPSPPVPAAEDEAVEKAARLAHSRLRWTTRPNGYGVEWESMPESSREGWREFVTELLDAAGVPALRERYESRDRDANAWQARAEAAEAEVERLREANVYLTARVDRGDNATSDALDDRDEARQQVADLRGRVEALLPGETVNVHAGGGNLVTQRRVIDPDRLRAALAGDTTEAGCSTCGGTGTAAWEPGAQRNSDADEQPCPDCTTEAGAEGRCASPVCDYPDHGWCPSPDAREDRVRHVLSSHGIEEDVFEGEGAAVGYANLVSDLIDAVVRSEPGQVSAEQVEMVCRSCGHSMDEHAAIPGGRCLAPFTVCTCAAVRRAVTDTTEGGA